MIRSNLWPQATTAFIFVPLLDTLGYNNLKAGSRDLPAIPPLVIRAVLNLFETKDVELLYPE